VGCARNTTINECEAHGRVRVTATYLADVSAFAISPRQQTEHAPKLSVMVV